MLRGALLGAGNIAQRGHMPAYLDAAVGGRCRIVAAADLCEENLNRLAGRIPGLQTYQCSERLLEEVRPDFVDICAPPYAHRTLIEQAAAFGCHILCEKPLTLTLDDALAIQSTLEGAPLVFMPGHQYHYSPPWQAVSTAIVAGTIGAPSYGVVEIERQRANDGNPYWQPAWRTSQTLSGGGILMDHGTHLFYQLQSIFGRLHRVAAHVEKRRHFDYGVEDTACCYLEYEGTLVRINLTWASSRRRTLHRYFGSAGQILCDESEVRITTGAGVRRQRFAQGFSGNSSHAEWYGPLLIDFLDRIAAADYRRAPLEEAIAAIRCTVAAYDAARAGFPVELGPYMGA